MLRRPQRFSCLFLVAIFCLSGSVLAERLPIKTYTSTDGLGSSFINYLMRDSRGFMWFCTRDGLSRFDGARFVTYQIGSSNAPPGIEGLAETSDGSYWITTTGGLYRFKSDALSQPDAANFSRPMLNAEYINGSRGVFFEDRKGNLWYGDGRLSRVLEIDGRLQFREVELNLPLPPNRSLTIIEMKDADDGSLWLNTTEGLVRRLPDGRLIFYPSDRTFSLIYLSFLLDENQRAWYVRGLEFYVFKPEPVASLSGLGRVTVRPLHPTYVLPARTEMAIRLPEKAGEILRFRGADFLKLYPAHRLCQTFDKHIWLTTDRELVEFDGRVFHRFADAQGLPWAMSLIAEDSAGNLWIGGSTVLIRLDRRGLTSYGEADGFHTASIHAINESNDGSLYFVDGGFYLNRFDGKHFQTEHLGLRPNPRFRWMSRFALLDSRNEWWILTEERLYRFASADLRRPLATYTSRDGLNSDVMFQIFEDRRGDIWVTVQPPNSEKNGLARFERSQNRFHSFTEAEGFPSRTSVSSFAEDNHGNLWLGFYEGGLARYSDGRFRVFGTADGVPEGVITDLQVDRSGRMWMSSSSGGACRIDDPGAETLTFASLTVDDGLSSNNIRTITEDHFGNIYLGTVRGVDRISPGTGHIKHYSVSDGLAGDFVVDSHCDKNGVLWFATTNGLSRLEPTAEEVHPAPAIWLGGLRVAGISQPIPELGAPEVGDLELSHTQNNVQLDFFGLEFHPGEALRYQYRLEGADLDWSKPSEQRTVTFANLRPGRYRFLVRDIDPYGALSERPATVSFRILPPIWLQWWFITIVSMLVAGIALVIIKERTARRRERERVRTRIATDLHDDIGASLSRIAVLSEVVKRQTEVDHHESTDMLSEIADSARGLVDSMSDIVWSIDPHKDDLKSLVSRIRQFASDVLEARAIDWEFKAPESIDHIKLSPEQRRHLFLIFKEAINNIARHSGCRSAAVDISVSHDRLVAEISDNGRGFATESASETPFKGPGGNGLRNMKARAAEIGGELKIVSSPGDGTRLTLVLPLRDHTFRQRA